MRQEQKERKHKQILSQTGGQGANLHEIQNLISQYDQEGQLLNDTIKPTKIKGYRAPREQDEIGAQMSLMTKYNAAQQQMLRT